MSRRSIRQRSNSKSKPIAHGLDSMPWRDLQKLASKAGVLERGMGRDEVVQALLSQDVIDGLPA